MLKDYSMLISRRRGTKNFKNLLPRIVYTAQLGDVANGLNLEIYTVKVVGNMANVAVVRPRYVVCVMVNGMGQKTVPKMRKPTDFLKLPSRLVGSGAIIVELWSS